MVKTIAGTVLAVLAVILYNVYREGGPEALRSWFSAKLLNKPTWEPPPKRRRYRGSPVTMRTRPGFQR